VIQANVLGAKRMVRSVVTVSFMLQLLLDVVVVEVLLLLFMYLKGISDLGLYLYPLLVTPVLMWLVYSNTGVYRRFLGPFDRALNLLWAWTKVGGILIALAFITKDTEDFSREVIALWFVSAAVLQIFVHIVSNYFIYIYFVRFSEKIPSVLVGNSEMGGYLAKQINNNPWLRSKIVGVIADLSEDEFIYAEGLPCLGGMDELRAMAEKYQIKRIYFALPMNTSHQIRSLQLSLLDLNLDIIWAPDIFGLHMISPSVKEIAGIPLYYLSESPMVEGAKLNKMLLDKLLAISALLLLSPVMLAAAVAVKFSSSGPVLFRQERHGMDGKIINVLKFRSMKVHREQEGKTTQATKNDARVTRVGSFLRKSSLDELPQLFNVLKGDMSLVGPRPHARAHNDYYASKIESYMSRHRILPGMTGLAQVNGCRGETDTLEKMEKRVEYDLAYINNWSIWMDIRILAKTVYTLFSKNAY